MDDAWQERRILSESPVRGAPVVRPARPADLEAIVDLCAAHARFERAALRKPHLRRELGRFLFGRRRRAWCLVAVREGRLVGYATLSREFSTWKAAEYVHLDCLFVRPAHRDAGLGRRLMQVVAAQAARLGCSFVEWQTPEWNAGARRFYERLGAAGKAKIRYRWRLSLRRARG